MTPLDQPDPGRHAGRVHPQLPQPLTVAPPVRDPAARAQARRDAQRERDRRRRDRTDVVRLDVTVDIHLRDAARAVAELAGLGIADLVRECLAYRVTCCGRSTAIREHLLHTRVQLGATVQCPLAIVEGRAAALDAELGALLWRLGGELASMRLCVEAIAEALIESEHVVEVYAATDASWRRCVREALEAAGVAPE